MNSIERIQEILKERDLDGLLLTDEKNQRYAAGFCLLYTSPSPRDA